MTKKERKGFMEEVKAEYNRSKEKMEERKRKKAKKEKLSAFEYMGVIFGILMVCIIVWVLSAS